MNLILLAVTTILAVSSSEETRDVQNVQNVQFDRLNDRNKLFQALRENESEDYDHFGGKNWLDAVPGIPGKDYPNLEIIPETSFSCSDKKPGGYYADVETRCQKIEEVALVLCFVMDTSICEASFTRSVFFNIPDIDKNIDSITDRVFHVCNIGNVKSSFLCPPGSIFNQKYLVCDWWYDFECENASELYSLNESINRGEIGSSPSGVEEYYTSNKDSLLRSIEESSFGHQETNWVNDGADLSLAGTGEGGLGYSGNKSNRPFQETDQSSFNQSYKQNDKNTNGRVQFDSSGYRREHFNSIINVQNMSLNSPTFKSEEFLDYIPRGFAVNYGKSEDVQNQKLNNQQKEERSQSNYHISFFKSKNISNTALPIVNALRKESVSVGENQKVPLESVYKNENSNNGGDFRKQEYTEANENSNFSEAEIDRQRQKEVDSTILNKKMINYEPLEQSRNYYNFEKHYRDDSNVHSSSSVNSGIKEDSNNQNRYLNANKEHTQFDQNSVGRQISNSNIFSGITAINLHSQNSESYSHLMDIANSNSKGFINKESADRSETVSNPDYNRFLYAPARISSRSRSFGQIREITTSRNVPSSKKSFEIKFTSNENVKANKNEQYSNHRSKIDQNVPFNNEDESQEIMKEI